VRHSWPPILLIQAAAACLVVAYYRSPGLQADLTSLEHFKANGGIAFDLYTGALAGGVVPQLAKLVTGRAGKVSIGFWTQMLFAGLVYAIVGVEIDLFYHLQAAMFGTRNDVLTLVRKDLVDMGLFTPFLSIPTAVGLFEWRKAGFSFVGFVRRVRTGFYRSKVMPALIPCWVFWTPMLLCVYSMPSNLQFPLSQLAEASWAVLFIFIAGGEAEDRS